MCIIAGAAALAGCARPAARTADHGWVRLNAVAGRPAAAYLTLHGGAAATALVGVTTPAAAHAEMHESMASGMRPIATVPVPADGAATFAPGGRHVMLIGPDPRLRAGGVTMLTLHFADGRALTISARVVGPADPAPAG